MRPATEPHPRHGRLVEPTARAVRRWGVHTTAATVTALLVGLGGCAQQVQVGRGGRLQVVLTEYRLRPDRVTVRAGRLSLIVRNLGTLSHNLSVNRASQVLARTSAIRPGGSARLIVRLSPGVYELASTMQSDEALGIRGALTVTKG